ncbi:MAG: hypothetical protein P8049_07095, partial [Gemmatimonadota bacterium]
AGASRNWVVKEGWAVINAGNITKSFGRAAAAREFHSPLPENDSPEDAWRSAVAAKPRRRLA